MKTGTMGRCVDASRLNLCLSEEEGRAVNTWLYSLYRFWTQKSRLIVFRGNSSQDIIHLAINGGTGPRVRATEDWSELVKRAEENVEISAVCRDESTNVPLWCILVKDVTIKGATFCNGSMLVIHDGMFLMEYNLRTGKVEPQVMSSVPLSFKGEHIAGWVASS